MSDREVITLYADGLCEPHNPGGWACYGWVAINEVGQELATGRGCVGHGPGMTNQIAEYRAAIEASTWALREGLGRVRLVTDSQLVTQQVNGAWAVHAEHLRPLCDQLKANVRALAGVLEWIPRTANRRADALSRLAYWEARQQRAAETAIDYERAA